MSLGILTYPATLIFLNVFCVAFFAFGLSAVGAGFMLYQKAQLIETVSLHAKHKFNTKLLQLFDDRWQYISRRCDLEESKRRLSSILRHRTPDHLQFTEESLAAAILEVVSTEVKGALAFFQDVKAIRSRVEGAADPQAGTADGNGETAAQDGTPANDTEIMPVDQARSAECPATAVSEDAGSRRDSQADNATTERQPRTEPKLESRSLEEIFAE